MSKIITFFKNLNGFEILLLSTTSIFIIILFADPEVHNSYISWCGLFLIFSAQVFTILLSQKSRQKLSKNSVE